jgi:hypothetical protein
MEKRQPPSRRGYGGSGRTGALQGLRHRAAWRWLFTYSHLVPSFATWYRAFYKKNIFRGLSRRLARGWREEPKNHLKTPANTWIHVRKTFLFNMKSGIRRGNPPPSPTQGVGVHVGGYGEVHGLRRTAGGMLVATVEAPVAPEWQILAAICACLRIFWKYFSFGQPQIFGVGRPTESGVRSAGSKIRLITSAATSSRRTRTMGLPHYL